MYIFMYLINELSIIWTVTDESVRRLIFNANKDPVSIVTYI